MEDELAKAKEKLVEEEKVLADLVKRRHNLITELDRLGDAADGKLKKDVRHAHHDINRKEGDIFLLKKRIKQLSYKIEIASKLSKLELEEDIEDIKSTLENVCDRLKKNKERVKETFDTMIEIQEKGKELAKGIEESRQKAMEECDIRADKLQQRLELRQDFLDAKRAEVRNIRRASGIPDPNELAEIKRLAALHEAACAGNANMDEEDDD